MRNAATVLQSHAGNDLAAPQENRPPDCFLIFAAPRVVGFGPAVFDLVAVADHVEAMHTAVGGPAIPVSRLVGELDAAAPSDDRAMVPGILFLNIIHLSDCCLGRAEGLIGTTSDAGRRCVRHGVDGCQRDGHQWQEPQTLQRLRSYHGPIGRHHEHCA